MELLAPAGTPEALRAAVENGADAVYLGGTRYSARAQAGNFEPRQMQEAVEYCHLRGVKVYVTVNTLLLPGESGAALQYVEELSRMAVDAVIVQDIGFAAQIRDTVPQLSIHASTQMSLHSTYDVEAVKQLGVERVVLARELSLPEVGAIRQATGVPVEVFVHGALCICYSGQCLMSSMIGGRSGNRGQCAQPCRLPWRLVTADGRALQEPQIPGPYGLSPKDRNFVYRIQELRHAGVDSVKIEGRMKRPEYVATVVRAYRDAIDGNLERAPELDKVFQRGFTEAPMFAPADLEMMSTVSPKHSGPVVGTVKQSNGRRSLLHFSAAVAPGDGIEVPLRGGGAAGITWQSETAAGNAVWVELQDVAALGGAIRQTKDARLHTEVAASFAPNQYRRRMGIHLYATLRLGEPLELTLLDGDGLSVTVHSQKAAETARTQALTRDKLTEQLMRLGDWPVTVEGLEIQWQPDLMLPWSDINQTRRRLLEQWRQQRLVNAQPRAAVRPEVVGRTADPYCRHDQPELHVAVCDQAQLKAALKAGARHVTYYGPLWDAKQSYGVEDLQMALRLAREQGAALAVGFDRSVRNAQWPLLLEMMELPGLAGVTAGNVGTLVKAQQRRQAEWRIAADWSLNTLNHGTAAELQRMGADLVYFSPEVNRSQMAEIAARGTVPMGLVVHGRTPLMVTEYCPFGQMRGGQCHGTCPQTAIAWEDRKGMRFPVVVDRYCRMHIFNAKELNLHAELAQVLPLAAAVKLDARLWDAESIGQWVSWYWERLEGSMQRAPWDGSLHTRGHLQRGVDAHEQASTALRRNCHE